MTQSFLNKINTMYGCANPVTNIKHLVMISIVDICVRADIVLVRAI